MEGPRWDWSQAGPCGDPRCKSSLCLLFLICRQYISFSLFDLPWVPKGRLKQFPIKEGRRRWDKGVLGTILVPQGIYITTYLWVLQELRPPPKWRMEWWWWPSWFQSTKAWTLLTLAWVLCWILVCSSPLPEYAGALRLKLFREKLLWGSSLMFSLLFTSNESFLLPSFGFVVSIGSTLTKRQTQFSGNKFGNSGGISLS